MPLDFQVVQAPMRFGLAEGVDAHQVPFGTMVTAENVCWSKTGLLEKRPGTAALPSSIVGGGNLSAASRLIVRGNELALTDGSTLYGYANGAWVSRGDHPELGLTWRTLTDSISGARASDVARLSDGRIVHAWATGDPAAGTATSFVYVQIQDADGSVTSAPTLLSFLAATMVKVIASGTSYVVIWVEGANLKAAYAGGTATLRTDVYDADPALSRKCFDAIVVGSEFLVAYHSSAPGIALARFSFAGPPVLQATGAVTGEASDRINSISLAGVAGEALFIAYSDAAAPQFAYACADISTLAQTLAPTTIATGPGATGTVGAIRSSANAAIVAFDFESDYTVLPGGYLFGTLSDVLVTSGGAVTPEHASPFLRLVSRPFALGSRFYAFAATYIEAVDLVAVSFEGKDLFLVDMTPGSGLFTHREVGKVEALIGGRWAQGFVCSPIAASATRVLAATPFTSSLPSLAGGLAAPSLTGELATTIGARSGVRLVEVTRGADLPPDMWRALDLGGEAFVAGGVLAGYDGVRACPYGWAHAAQIDPASRNGLVGGGSMTGGDYLYNTVPERRGNTGLLHRGPTGIPVTVNVPGGFTGSVSVAISYVGPTFASTGAAQGVLALYRSVQDGTTLQRLTIEPTYNTILNSFPATSAFYLDTASDGNIGGNVALSTRPAIYTAGGELDDTQPVACITGCLHRNRFFLVSGDEQTVWISKDYSTNVGTAPGFHPTMTLWFPEPIAAVASMDEKLIAFSASRPYYVLGDGPAPNGQQSDYTSPTPIQADVGCTNARSVVSTPDGLMFLSARGIYLLTRALELVWIGRPVKDEIAAYPNVTSAVLVASRSEVRITANNAGGTAGITLVYNYVEKQWTTWKHTVGGVYGAPIADACMWGGAWTFVTPAGVVVQESASTWLDDAAWVPITIETAWVNASGPLAFQSVRRFTLEGAANTNHDLTLSVGFDSDTSYPQTKTFAAGSSVTSIGPFEACWITIGTRRKCQAIRFKIQDATPTNPGSYPVGNGRGPSIDAIGVEVGFRKGLATKDARHMG